MQESHVNYVRMEKVLKLFSTHGTLLHVHLVERQKEGNILENEALRLPLELEQVCHDHPDACCICLVYLDMMQH